MENRVDHDPADDGAQRSDKGDLVRGLGAGREAIMGATLGSAIAVNLYCDEIKEVVIHDPVFGDERWAYIGLLVVPVAAQNVLLKCLLDRRCSHPLSTKEWGSCETKCTYHARSDTEVHYQEIESDYKFVIADRWLDFVLEDKELTRFYILGIDLGRLDYSCFGQARPSERFQRIYNRFFRTAILKSVKTYFRQYEAIVVQSIIHDESEFSHGEYFPWHCIYRIGNDDTKVRFECDHIDFLGSDHRKTGDVRSHFIQYIDIILGSIYNALHWSSHNVNKTKVALKMAPMLRRLMDKPGNVNSRFQYVGRLEVDFFPQRSYGSLTELERDVARLGSFYKHREIRVNRSILPSLFG